MPILHEDANLLVIDKPIGVSSIPERDVAVPSAQRLLESARGEKLFIVERLDKEVSGLLVFARDEQTHRTVSLAFEQRRARKIYVALAHGVIARDGVIDKPIAQFGSGRMGVHEKKGKPSRTEYSIVERYAAHTLVHARPVTGRRHQVRVHFYAIGHALVGDPRYGDATEQAKWPRLMLHALRVELEGLTVECPPPPTFVDQLERLKSTLLPR
jgi:tRNA pseudouridine32 synthase/23S rRNA pseudouridine746 synthase